MSYFNLDIDSYNIKELQDLLGLKETCNKNDINDKCANMLQTIKNDKTIEDMQQEKIIVFIDVMKQRLIDNYDRTENVVIPSAPYATKTHEVNYVKDKLNPLYKNTIKRYLVIDSSFRKNYYATKASDFHQTLSTQLKNVVSMQVKGLVVPEINTIDKTIKNNFFYINNDKVELPSSNIEGYDSIANKIQTEINSLGYGAVTVTYNSDTRKIIFDGLLATDTIYFANHLDLGDDPPIMRLGWLLGFRNAIYTGSTSYITESPTGNYTRNNPYYLCIDDFNNNHNDVVTTNYSKSVLQNNILVIILGEYILPKRDYFGPVNIEKLHIQLLDKYGRIVNMNNNDLSFVLELECLYD